MGLQGVDKVHESRSFGGASRHGVSVAWQPALGGASRHGVSVAWQPALGGKVSHLGNGDDNDVHAGTSF